MKKFLSAILLLMLVTLLYGKQTPSDLNISKDATYIFRLDGKLYTGSWEYFIRESNNILYEGNIKKGKIEGVLKVYEDFHTLRAEILFKNGVPASSKEFDSKEKLIAEVSYKNFLPDGKVKTYYPEGKIFAEVNYREGKKDGVIKNYHKNGRLAYEGKYNKGVLVDISRSYFDDGKLATESYHNQRNEDGDRVTNTKHFYRNGKMAFEIVLGKHPYKDSDDVKITLREETFYNYFYENGKIAMKNVSGNSRENKSYGLDGKEIGELGDKVGGSSTGNDYEYSDFRGKTKIGYEYDRVRVKTEKYGEKILSNDTSEPFTGINKTYFSNERNSPVRNIEIGIFGFINGNFKRFFKNGLLATEQPVIKGTDVGRIKIYHENGKLMSAGDDYNKYQSNRGGSKGPYTEFYYTGEIEEKIEHDNGAIITTKYDWNGQIKSKEIKVTNRFGADTSDRNYSTDEMILSSESYEQGGYVPREIEL